MMKNIDKANISELLTAQMENSLLKTAISIIEGDRITPDNIDAFAQFIQSLILFEKIVIVKRPNRETNSLENIPSFFRKYVFSNPTIEDFGNRINKAKITVNTILGRYSKLDSSEMHIRKVLQGLNNILLEQSGNIGVERFWNNINFLVSAESKDKYISESLNNLDKHFDASELKNSSLIERLAIYSSWRCAYNLDLARDFNRQYLINPSRIDLITGLSMPLKAARLIDFEGERLQNSLMDIFKSLNEVKFWSDLFLKKVLRIAKKPENIWDAIKKIRLNEGQDFRYECKERFKEKNIDFSIKKIREDLSNIFQNKGNLRIPISLQFGPVSISEDFVNRFLEKAAKIGDHYIPEFIKHRRFEMFWGLIRDPQTKSEIRDIVKDVFGYDYNY